MEVSVIPHPELEVMVSEYEHGYLSEYDDGSDAPEQMTTSDYWDFKMVYPAWQVHVEGVELYHWPQDEGERDTYVSREAGLILLVNSPSSRWDQAGVEAEVWDQIEPQDRPFFAELLSYGYAQDGSGWVLKRYYPDLIGVPYYCMSGPLAEKYPAPEHVNEVYALVEKYGLEADFGSHQWKHTADGGFLIHDYGISDLCRKYA